MYPLKDKQNIPKCKNSHKAFYQGKKIPCSIIKNYESMNNKKRTNKLKFQENSS